MAESPEIKVLDKGFVKLIDHLGSDLSVVNAARVSYGKRKDTFEEGDAKLINYLAKHEHTSPFRHTAMTLHVKAPIFVFRQWMKHRIGCLTADTVVTFLNTNGEASPQTGKTMGELWRLWNEGQANGTAPSEAAVADVRRHLGEGRSDREIETLTGVARATVRKIRENRFSRLRSAKNRIRKMRLRVLNEAENSFEVGRIEEVLDKGIQPVYRLDLEGGRQISLTRNHLVLTPEGWRTMGEAVGLEHSEGAEPQMTRLASLMANGAEAYRDGEWMAGLRRRGASVDEMAQAAGCSYHTIRKWLKRHELSFGPGETRFEKGASPWNEGLSYRNGPMTLTLAQRQKRAFHRSGERSNFWRGGVSTERQRVAAWVARQAPLLHAQNGHACGSCGAHASTLHAHHIVPVWMDPSRSRDISNLTSLCEPCHRAVHRNRESELAFAKAHHGALDPAWEVAPRRSGDHRLLAHPVKVLGITYLGMQQTFDLRVKGDWHNFVANGLVVHNSEFNEISGRYVEFPEDEFYVPEVFRQQAKVNKQGSEGAVEDQGAAHAAYLDSCRASVAQYKALLALGVCKEQARCVLPLGLYSEVYWTVSLQAAAHFIRLRSEGHAQWEIQRYAEAVRGVVEGVYPVSLKALLASDIG